MFNQFTSKILQLIQMITKQYIYQYFNQKFHSLASYNTYFNTFYDKICFICQIFTYFDRTFLYHQNTSLYGMVQECLL